MRRRVFLKSGIFSGLAVLFGAVIFHNKSVNLDYDEEMDDILLIDKDVIARCEEHYDVHSPTKQENEDMEQILKDAKDLAKNSDTIVKISVELFEKTQGLIESFPWAKVHPAGTVEYVYPIEEFPLWS